METTKMNVSIKLSQWEHNQEAYYDCCYFGTFIFITTYTLLEFRVISPHPIGY